MIFRTLVFTYLLGGLTFLPLLFVAVITAGWYLLPRESECRATAPAVEEAVTKDEQEKRRHDSLGETAASGTFAVLRQYDFQAAISALNARNSVSGTAHGNSAVDGGAAVETTASNSESVYQSMYRSVFVGNRSATSASSLLHDEDAESSAGTRRKIVPANVMHIILRHGHLMLYGSPAHVDVKHVISLAHHTISLQAAKDGNDADETQILEPDLFTKRTAIVLTPIELPDGVMQQQQPKTQKTARPFYLFCATNIDKEDFYRALLLTRPNAPTPRPLDTDALTKLQSALHSSLLTPEMRALNAILGRAFLAIHKTDRLVEFVRSKIEKKIARIQKPSFIPIIEIRSLDLGDAAPVFSNLKLRDLNISGETTISADVRYNGGLSITLLAVAKLDLGSRFKARTVTLVLKTSLRRIHGTMLLHVKSAPTNRMWFCFESMPELEIRVEPVVSERKITYGFVLRAIEERVRAAFGEGLVKPNWDDIPMPLQDTRGSHARGSLWLDDGDSGEEKERVQHQQQRSDESPRVTADPKSEKAMSTTALVQDDTGSSTGLLSSSEVHSPAKIRHAATMPAEGHGYSKRRSSGPTRDAEPRSPERSPLPPPKPLRSPSITSISPSVAMDGQTVEPVRSDDATLRPAASAQRKLWRTRGMPAAGALAPQKNALDGLRDLRARAEQAAAGRSPSIAADATGSSGDEASITRFEPVDDDQNGTDEKGSSTRSTHSRQLSEGSVSTISATTPSSFSIHSMDSDQPTTSAALQSGRGQQFQQRKANILAAAGAATNAARNWGWNTYQKNKGAFQRGGGGAMPSEPIGRGQPLPPPGQPLPGPMNKGLWSGMGSTRRKPVPNLPPRPMQPPTGSSEEGSKQAITLESDNGSKDARPTSMAEDEFGNWHENSGDVVAVDNDIPELAESYKNPLDANSDLEPKLKKIPPPLPRRRRSMGPQEMAAPEVSTSVLTSTSELDIETVPGEEQRNTPSEPTDLLRVPEHAAKAIAAENATSGLTYGDSDDVEHVDGSRAIETEVLPNRNHADIAQIVGDDDDTEELELKKTVTSERFARGEDVTEEDFERDNVVQQTTSETAR